MLRGDGLGVVSFGDGVDETMTILTDLFGPPSHDVIDGSVWGEGSPFAYFREVRWSSPLLRLEFSDRGGDGASLDMPEFTYWAVGRSEIPLTTADGVGPGTRWADAASIYADRIEFVSSEECDGQTRWLFVFDGNVSVDRLIGFLDGDPADPTTSITYMEAGLEAFPQGC